MNSPRGIDAQNVCDTSATMWSENLTHSTFNQSGVASGGAAEVGLTPDALRVMRCIELPLPPLDHQREIVELYGQFTGDLSVAVSRSRREIDLLQEFRIRLVADVVTGQVDIREIAESLPELHLTGLPQLLGT